MRLIVALELHWRTHYVSFTLYSFDHYHYLINFEIIYNDYQLI